jgi:hypothetical protein
MHDGALARFSRAVRVLSNIHQDRWTGRGGPTACPPRSPDFSPLDFYPWEHLKPLVYAAPVDNEEALHHLSVDACQTIRNCPAIFVRMWRSMMRRVEACTESHGGHLIRVEAGSNAATVTLRVIRGDEMGLKKAAP